MLALSEYIVLVYARHMVAAVSVSASRALDEQMAGAAGLMNVAHAELTRLTAEAIENNTWSGASPKHWVVHCMGTNRITGNADDPNSLVFTDEHGRRIEPCGAPLPPTELPDARYRAPSMERVDWQWVGLNWPDP